MKKENTIEACESLKIIQNKEILNSKELCQYLSMTRTTLWRLEKEDLNFPKPVMILSQKKWKRSEIDEYLEKTRDVGKE
jgi:predicted DNA-binding transcriptional regulator AlpA